MELIEIHTTVQQNAQVLKDELSWLSLVIHTRLELYFEQDTPYQSIDELLPPNVMGKEGTYAAFIQKTNLNTAERLVLILGLVPHIKPEVLDILLTKNKNYDRRYSEFGGLLLDEHAGLIPTAETGMFILAGDNLGRRLSYEYLFAEDHVFATEQVIKETGQKKAGPRLSRTWMVADEYIGSLISGKPYHPTYNADFPAQQITTRLEWEDIVLSRNTAEHLQEIRDWIAQGHVLMNDLKLGKMLKPGYKSLFYGPPGTGKTMTAALLGKSTNKQVYRIDLSMVVSKYIGETEKNLAKVFDQAAKRDWILFFDEADSLFGKRTQVNSANDRHGNQEIGYLLQRIEDFPGVVILASNLKGNIDEAFTRRFQSMVAFNMPGVEERYKLWEQSFSTKLPLDATIDMWAIAEKYELSGGAMINVVRKVTLRAVTKQQKTILQKELEAAIHQELQKEGIILN
ncbi:MAG: ATP-binding protein [Algibacter sp.]